MNESVFECVPTAFGYHRLFEQLQNHTVLCTNVDYMSPCFVRQTIGFAARVSFHACIFNTII